MNFEEYGAGFAHIRNEIKNGILPKTFLIEGKDEKTRSSAAALCAAALVCTSEDTEAPCTVCPQCVKVLEGRHPDVSVVKPGDTAVKVDDIRHLRQDAYISPFEAEVKIFIIEQAQTLNVQSQNALLKILEEPPEKVYFILTAPTANMLLPTVNSRCAKFSLGTVGRMDVYRSVSEFSGNASESRIGRLCNAIMYLDGFVISQESIEMLDSSLDICDKFYSSGKFPFSDLPSKKENNTMLKLIFRLLALCALEISECKKGVRRSESILESEVLNSACSRYALRAIFTQYEFFCSITERMEANANTGAVIAAVRAQMCEQR